MNNLTRQTLVGDDVKVARSFFARGRGLMLRRSLPHGSGLLIDPCGSIHMFFMRFPLDVLYVDANDCVVRTQRSIRPWRVGPLKTPGAKYVIELPAGAIEASGSEVGDQLSIVPAEDDAER